ncbi:MAG: GerMN domain-containing protein [Clostridium sp.]|uniref:GerMN domain-containing protein n=1 Tax=Clostridium sp. TaxID=1506 RepID=UPI0030554248
MKKKTFSLVLIAIVVGVAVLIGIIYASKTMGIKKDKASMISKEKLQNSTSKDDNIDIDLYFGGNGDKADIVKEQRLISSEEFLGEIIMQELIKGPAVVSESKPVFPKGTRLLSFSIKDKIAYISLSNEVVLKMTSVQEGTLLKSITTSLTQLSSIEKVMITIDNQGVETLGGNYNISKPFSKDEIENLRIQQ